MYPDILTVGPFTIHGYGLMIGIGILCAFFVAEFRAKKRDMNTNIIYGLAFFALIFGFVGAKLLFALVNLPSVIKNPMLMLSGAGFAVQGGIIGGVAAGILFCRIKHVEFLQYCDVLIPSVALAQGFGRIGCFLAGCCYGRETDSIFGIIFNNSPYAPNGVRLWPTQLMSAAGNFLIAAVLILYAKKPRAAGRVSALYLVMFGGGRFIVEYFRSGYSAMVGVFSAGQFISLFILAAGLMLFFKDFIIGKVKRAAGR
ncbi:prolipoprotein diacylglyceryl transferase [Acetanaerobacterium elongatum]|uniref:Phosphatidylglycerol--prolipoprotein diacylglyceryl transferase n=1 Tax=Acetanaerobacterium elongatum TaxID=258515 RepID=A0A1H0GTF0_9FIRM|nr:prolipoprotein diacylglyceryl transferase [Acetanaerobacterium elongatum]SDO10167.1 phosphatidylglycerol:prolipoprotein diacylglycerol transferase [Acetanaerobacterium elongatum]